MNPAYIYFKEINIDQDETFTADFSKKTKTNEIEYGRKRIWNNRPEY